MKLSIFSCACYSSVCLLLKNVFSHLLPILNNKIFKIIMSFFILTELYELFIYICLYVYMSNNISTSCWTRHLQTFSPFCRLSFHVLNGFLCCAKLLSLIRSHFFTFAFISLALGDIQNVLVQFVKRVVCLCSVP